MPELTPIDFLSDRLWLVLAVSGAIEAVCWIFDPAVEKRYREAEAAGAVPHHGWRSSKPAPGEIKRQRLGYLAALWVIGVTIWFLTDEGPEGRPIREAVAGALLVPQVKELLSWWRAFVQYGALKSGGGEGRFRWRLWASTRIRTAGAVGEALFYLGLWLLLGRTFFLGAAVPAILLIPMGVFASWSVRRVPPSSESPVEDAP